MTLVGGRELLVGGRVDTVGGRTLRRVVTSGRLGSMVRVGSRGALEAGGAVS